MKPNIPEGLITITVGVSEIGARLGPTRMEILITSIAPEAFIIAPRLPQGGLEVAGGRAGGLLLWWRARSWGLQPRLLLTEL